MAQGAHTQWEAGCQHRAVEPAPGRRHQAGPTVGRGASSQGPRRAAGRRTATWAGLRNPAQPMTHASPGPDGAAVPRPPQGHKGAAHRSNSSWRTNNLTHWSAGGSQAGEHPWQHLPGPALPCPQGQPAASQGRGSSSEAEAWGCPGGRAPSASPVSPRDPPGASSPLAALRQGAAGWWAGQALALFLLHAQLVATQVVVEGLHVGEDTLGIWLLPHDHHVFHLHQRHAVHQRPAETQTSAWLPASCPTPGAGMGDPRCPRPAGTAALSSCPPLSTHCSPLMLSDPALGAGSHPLQRLC